MRFDATCELSELLSAAVGRPHAFGCQRIVTYRLDAGSWSAQPPHNSPEPTMGGKKKKKSKGKMLTNPVYGATELTVRAAPQLN